jgi:hypothetical protein
VKNFGKFGSKLLGGFWVMKLGVYSWSAGVSSLFVQSL